MHKRWIVILAACAASGAAIAADQPDAGRPHWDPAAIQQRHAEREARRADEMALLLGLRPDQRSAFDRFLQSMRPPHDGPDGVHDAGLRKPTADDTPLPARLDAMEASIDRHDTMAKQKIDATRQFYASLTPDQQHRFDALDDLRRDRMNGRHGGLRRAGGFGGDHPAVAQAGD
jgi:Spy/CpxP family protein refolding chaperone